MSLSPLIAILGLGFGRHAQLRGWYRRIVLAKARPLKRLRLIRKALVWPLTSFILACDAVAQYGKPVSQTIGLRKISQLQQCYFLSLLLGVTPYYYYRFRWFRHSWRCRAAAFIPSSHLHILIQSLWSENTSVIRAILENKDRFTTWCRTNSLPCVSIIAIFEDGRAVEADPSVDMHLPPCDLFIKPSDGRWGDGAFLWKYLGEGIYMHGKDSPLVARELIEHLRLESGRNNNHCRAAGVDRSQKSRLLLQPALKNHPSISLLSQLALCTVRVVTLRACDGTTSVLSAVFRMALGESEVDNASRGGIVSLIDLSSGSLSPALSLDPSKCTEIYTAHPDTGARIDGITLPWWRETLSLALRAHNAAPHLLSIGWDIALLESGPCLVEANSSWGGDLIQLSPTCALGDSAFADLFLKIVR